MRQNRLNCGFARASVKLNYHQGKHGEVMLIPLERLILVALISLQPTSMNRQAPMSQAESYFHFIAGTLASLDKDSKSALEHFQFAAHLDPSASTLLVNQASELLELGDIEKAKTLLDGLEKELSSDTEYQLLISRIASQELDVDRAVKALNRAIDIFKREDNDLKVRESVLSKVALLADFKRYEDCVKTLKEYLKQSPDDEVAYYFLGKIHSVFQHREDAKKAFRKALDLRPNFSAATRSLGLQLELEGKLTEAMSVYQQAAENGLSDEDLYQKLVNMALILEDYETALKYLKQYLVLRPDDDSSLLRAGLIHFKLGNLPEAKEIFENLLKQGNTAEDRVRFYLGSVYEELKETAKAIEHYAAVAASSDYYTESRLQAAVLFQRSMKQDDAAIRILEEGIKQKSDSSELVLALANALDRQARFQEGADLLLKATSQFKQHEKILFMLGVFQDKLGLPEKAVLTMKSVLEVNPNNAHALNHIGYSYVDRNINLPEAEVLLKKAVQLAPDNGFIMDSLGWLYYRMGRFQKAAEFLEKANKVAPGQIIILEHLADTYKRMGRNKEALAVYRQIMGWSTNANAESKAELAIDEPDQETKQVQDRVRVKIADFGSNNAN